MGNSLVMRRFLLISILAWPLVAEAPQLPVLTAEAKLAVREAELRLQVAWTAFQKAQGDFNTVLAANAPAGYAIEDNGTALVLVKKPVITEGEIRIDPDSKK